jgi:hypothetical protein
MIEEVLPGVFRMAVPLPRSPLKATNSYLILDSERSLVVDTAFNRPSVGMRSSPCSKRRENHPTTSTTSSHICTPITWDWPLPWPERDRRVL